MYCIEDSSYPVELDLNILFSSTNIEDGNNSTNYREMIEVSTEKQNIPQDEYFDCDVSTACVTDDDNSESSNQSFECSITPQSPIHMPASKMPCIKTGNKNEIDRKFVRFGNVEVREYSIQLDTFDVEYSYASQITGPQITLGWEYADSIYFEIDEFEIVFKRHYLRRLSAYQRKNLLRKVAGLKESDFQAMSYNRRRNVGIKLNRQSRSWNDLNECLNYNDNFSYNSSNVSCDDVHLPAESLSSSKSAKFADI